MFRDSTHLLVRHPTTQKSVTLKLWLSKRRYDATGLINSLFHISCRLPDVSSPHNTELQWNVCSKQPWFICIQQAMRPKHNKRLAVTPKGSQNFFFKLLIAMFVLRLVVLVPCLSAEPSSHVSVFHCCCGRHFQPTMSVSPFRKKKKKSLKNPSEKQK